MIAKNILLVDSSYPINTRNERFISSLRKSLGTSSIRFAAWNRDNRIVNERDKTMCIYQSSAKYGSKLLKSVKMYGYYKYLKNIFHNEHIDIVIASHWDCLLLCTLLKKKKQILVYENLDIPTSSNFIVLQVLRCIERICLYRTDAIVFASRFYKSLYTFYKGVNFVIENKLPFENCSSIKHCLTPEKKIVISFLGNIRYPEILRNLILAVGNCEGIHCNIYGDGPDFGKIKKIALKYGNVSVLGRYEYSEISKIYECSDVIWAVYPSKDYNVRYAISNKYHESLYYGVPAIYAEGTKLADMVEKDGIGYVVNPYSIDSIKQLFANLKKNGINDCNGIYDKLKKKQNSETKNWDEEFVPFIEYICTVEA